MADDPTMPDPNDPRIPLERRRWIPWRFVGRWAFSANQLWGSWCLIGQNYVLTAAHVFNDSVVVGGVIIGPSPVHSANAFFYPCR